MVPASMYTILKNIIPQFHRLTNCIKDVKEINQLNYATKGTSNIYHFKINWTAWGKRLDTVSNTKRYNWGLMAGFFKA